MNGRVKRQYAFLPNDVIPHLDALVRELRDAGVTRQYAFIGRVFGVSASTVEKAIRRHRGT